MTCVELPQGLGRNYRRLQAIYEIRLANADLAVISTDAKRNKLLFLTWAELHPDTSLAKWLNNAIKDDPYIFQKMKLTPADTLLRDNRQLEIKGLFAKKAKVKHERFEPQTSVIDYRTLGSNEGTAGFQRQCLGSDI